MADKKVEKKQEKTGDYSFAVNTLKLQRAINAATLEAGGKTPSDELVKAHYVKLGGLLAEEEESATALGRKIMKAPSFKDVKARG